MDTKIPQDVIDDAKAAGFDADAYSISALQGDVITEEVLALLALRDQRQAVPDEFQEPKSGDDFFWQRVYSVDQMQRFFMFRLPAIREAARQCGYAIGVHGSCRRDFDLIAVPWVEKHANKDELATAIQKAACGLNNADYRWEEKPNGRFAVSMPICWPEWPGCHGILSLGMIDLSVMPALAPTVKDSLPVATPPSSNAEGVEIPLYVPLLEIYKELTLIADAATPELKNKLRAIRSIADKAIKEYQTAQPAADAKPDGEVK